jgi:hypothetical protein
MIWPTQLGLNDLEVIPTFDTVESIKSFMIEIGAWEEFLQWHVEQCRYSYWIYAVIKNVPIEDVKRSSKQNSMSDIAAILTNEKIELKDGRVIETLKTACENYLEGEV